MGDMIENFRAMDDIRKLLRAELGVPCPECVRLLPRAHPSQSDVDRLAKAMRGKSSLRIDFCD